MGRYSPPPAEELLDAADYAGYQLVAQTQDYGQAIGNLLYPRRVKGITIVGFTVTFTNENIILKFDPATNTLTELLRTTTKELWTGEFYRTSIRGRYQIWLEPGTRNFYVHRDGVQIAYITTGPDSDVAITLDGQYVFVTDSQLAEPSHGILKIYKGILQ